MPKKNRKTFFDVECCVCIEYSMIVNFCFHVRIKCKWLIFLIKTDWSVSAYFSADVSIYTNVKNCLIKPLMNDKIVNVINFFTERIQNIILHELLIERKFKATRLIFHDPI